MSQGGIYCGMFMRNKFHLFASQLEVSRGQLVLVPQLLSGVSLQSSLHPLLQRQKLGSGGLFVVMYGIKYGIYIIYIRLQGICPSFEPIMGL